LRDRKTYFPAFPLTSGISVSSVIETIKLGGVNCYLIKDGENCFMVDTGFSSKRAELDKRLESLGCTSGNFKLIILTHGDLDHAGNGAFLREKYGTLIAMHRDDAAMVEHMDINANRKAKPDRVTLSFRVIRHIAPLLFPSGQFDRFKPDIYLEDGQDLSSFGLSAKVVGTPGHSKGSICILTAEGDLFCGDLLRNVIGGPSFPMIDDMAAARASIAKLRKLDIKKVYPGHGKPFTMDAVHI
jgi:glyoxylase-like metal-dependent hydrolase (beta-lactamase superfamily II)